MPQGIDGFLNKCETIFDQTHFAIKVMNDYLNAHKGGNEIFKNNIIKFLQAADKNKYGDLSGLLKTLQDIPNLQKKIDNMVSYRIKLNDLIKEIKTYKNTKSVQEGIEATQELNPQQMQQQAQQQPQQNNLRVNNLNNPTRNNLRINNLNNPSKNNLRVNNLNNPSKQNNNQQTNNNQTNQNTQLPLQNQAPTRKFNFNYVITRIVENGKYVAIPQMDFNNISKIKKQDNTEKENWIHINSASRYTQYNTLDEAKNYCENYSTVKPKIVCRNSVNLNQTQINNNINNNRNTNTNNNNRNTNANTNNINQRNTPTNISSTNNVQTTQEEHNKHKQSLLKSIKDKIFNRKNNNQQSSQNNQPIQNQQMMQYGPNGMPINPQYQQQPMNMQYQQPMNMQYQQPMNMQYQQPMNPQYQPQYDQFGNPIIPMMPNQQMMQYGPNGMPMNPQYQPQFDQYGNPINNTNGNRTK